MQVLKSIDAYTQWRNSKKTTIGFVPTMGALHNGHLSLVRLSKKACEQTVVSIFLNPKQFAKNEDLKSYPNTIKEDLEKLKQENVDAVFMPGVNEIYINNQHNYWFDTPLALKLEGKSRPHFFKGVTMVVHKLFQIIQPTHAIFGQKDAQQLLIIKKMLQDMNYNIQCVSMPTIRDKNGLALSSRNQYLSAKEIKIAANVYRGLLLIQNRLNSGSRHVPDLSSVFINYIGAFSEIKLDYLSFSNLETLEDVQTINNQDVLISVAVYIRSVRLIDNIIYAV